MHAATNLATSEPGQRMITIDVIALSTWIALLGVEPVWHQLLSRLATTGHAAWRCRALIDLAIVLDAHGHKKAQTLGRTGIIELDALDTAAEPTNLDIDQHALEVSAALRFLQRHLENVIAGSVAPREQEAVGFILQAVKWSHSQG